MRDDELEKSSLEGKCRWVLIAKYPFLGRGQPHVAGAKNYQRLCARYPSIMPRLGLNEFSAF
jgi:hypothetical protein